MKRIVIKVFGLTVMSLLLTQFAIAQALPDLTVLSVNGPSRAGTGQSVSLTNTLANIGTAPASNWRYRVYVSTNAAITTNDTILGTFGTFFDFAGQTAVTNIDTVVIPANNPTGTCYFGVIVDYDNSVTESNEANNMLASAPTAVYPGPDLTPISVGGPSGAGTGQTLTLTNILANIGVGAAGNWLYRIYLSTNATVTTNATVLTTQGPYNNTPAQSSMTNYDTVTIPAGTTPGTYFFGVIIDFDNMITEANESNNTQASAPVTIGIGPDLTVSAIAYPSLAGTAQTLTLTNVLANIGAGSAGNWKYRVYLSTNASASVATNGLVLTTQGAFVNFPALTSVTNYDAVTIPDTLATGVYYFAVMIDFDNSVVESVETNNIRVSGPVTIGIGPDLTVLSITGPNRAGPGQPFTLMETLANIGIGDAGNWSYRIYLSTNAAVTTNDTVLTTLGTFTSFPALTTLTNTDTVTIPQGTPPGNYYLGVIIDFNNVVAESNEGNNFLSAPSMPVGPMITGITVQTNTVSVNVTGLAVATGYSLLFKSTLTDSNSWTTGTLFTAQGLATNCVDSLSPSTPMRFYRIGQQ